MGYYRLVGRGDFYRGARGDPGFLSFLGNLGKQALGFIPGIGPIAKNVVDVASGALSKVGGSKIVKAGTEIVKTHPALTAAGGAGLLGAGGGVLGAKLMHSGSPAAAGAAMNGAGRSFGGGKRRRMNPYNPRALRRALRRTHSFAKMARQIIRVSSHYKHPKRFKIGHFKKRSKK